MKYATMNYHYSKTIPAGATFGYSVFNNKNDYKKYPRNIKTIA